MRTGGNVEGDSLGARRGKGRGMIDDECVQCFILGHIRRCFTLFCRFGCWLICCEMAPRRVVLLTSIAWMNKDAPRLFYVLLKSEFQTSFSFFLFFCMHVLRLGDWIEICTDPWNFDSDDAARKFSIVVWEEGGCIIIIIKIASPDVQKRAK